MAGKAGKGRSTPRSGRGKRTREAVLAAAVAVFGREGVRQTSMLAIAQEAGVASGTVYQYFADKEDIFRVLLDQLEDDLRSAIEMPVEQDGQPDLADMVRRYLAVHRENVAIYRAWWDLLEPRTEFTDAWLATHGRLAGSIAELVSKDRDPELAGHLGAILFERPAYSRNIMGWDEELTDEEVSDLIGRLLGNGLFAGAAA